MPYVPSTAEAALTALQALLQATGTDVVRNVPLDVVLANPTAGQIVLRDGEPGEPEITMSPLMYYFEHLAEVEVFAPDGDDTATSFLDGIGQQIGTAIAADRTLGGVVEWVDIRPGRAVDLPSSGESTIHAMMFSVMLAYATATPLT